MSKTSLPTQVRVRRRPCLAWGSSSTVVNGPRQLTAQLALTTGAVRQGNMTRVP